MLEPLQRRSFIPARARALQRKGGRQSLRAPPRRLERRSSRAASATTVSRRPITTSRRTSSASARAAAAPRATASRWPREQTRDADRLAGLLAVAVAAVLDVRERLVDLLHELALAVAGAQLERVLLLDRRAVGGIGHDVVLAQVLGGEARRCRAAPASSSRARSRKNASCGRVHVLIPASCSDLSSVRSFGLAVDRRAVSSLCFRRGIAPTLA